MRTQRQQPRGLKQAGFTLIELIIVIVIIGILAAVAIPKFTELTKSAQSASTKALAAELGAAATIYYAKKTVDSTTTAVADCAALNSSTLYMQTPIDTGTSGYTISGGFDTSGCTVTLKSDPAITSTVKVPF